MSSPTTAFSKYFQFILIIIMCLTAVVTISWHYSDIFGGNNMFAFHRQMLYLNSRESPQVKAKRNGTNVSNETNTNLSQCWQHAGITKDLYVFSAYYKEENTTVQIIGIALLHTKVNCSCIFPRRKGTKQYVVNGTIEMLPEHHNKSFGAVFIYCPLKMDYKPKNVGIMVENVTTYLRVIYASPRRYNFTVCTPSLHGPYNDQFRIVEMVEADMLLGVEYFVVYNYSVSPEVDKVLRYYEKRGFMEIKQWNLPNTKSWYWGQIASLQDCICASRNRSRFVVLKDFDELIVPHKHKTLNELMAELDKNNSKYAAFLFRNSMFRLNWKRDIVGLSRGSSAEQLKIRSLLYIWRENYFHKFKARTKAIVHPKEIITGGIHFEWKLKKGYEHYDVNTTLAFLHHYRIWNGKVKKVKDERMRQFSDDLINNVNKTFIQLGYKNVNGTYRFS